MIPSESNVYVESVGAYFEIWISTLSAPGAPPCPEMCQFVLTRDSFFNIYEATGQENHKLECIHDIGDIVQKTLLACRQGIPNWQTNDIAINLKGQ